MPGLPALCPAWVSLSATLPLPVCERRNVLPLWVGSFKNLCPLVTSRSFASSGQRAALRGRLPVGARSRPTFPRELPGRLTLASPFRRTLGPTVRSPGRRYRTSLGWGFAATGRQLAGARGGLRRGGRTRQGAPRGARGARRRAPSTPWTGRAMAAPRQPSSQPPGRHAALPSAVFFLECPPCHLKTRLSRGASASLHLAPG